MERVLEALGAVYQKALANLKTKVVVNGRLNGDRLNDEQLAGHALAYLATELEACKQLAAWSARVGGEFEGKVARAYIGELARNLRGGVDLGACENIALADLGLTDADLADTLLHPDVQGFSATHSTGAIYLEIAQHARDKGFGNLGLDDEMLEEIRGQFAKFSRVAGHAEWVTDERFATNAQRVRNIPVLAALLEERFSAWKRTDLIAALEAEQKEITDALADGNTIHAVIRGVAVNNDGAVKASFTAPSVDGQAAVVAAALRAAEVEREGRKREACDTYCVNSSE